MITPAHTHIVKKYAQAYLEVYPDTLSQDLIALFTPIIAYLQDHKDLIFFLSLSSISLDEKKSFVQKFCSYFGLQSSVEKLIILLLHKKDIMLLREVFEEIVILYKKHHTIIDVDIHVAADVTQEEVAVMVAFFEKLSKQKVHAHVTVDANIIAGIKMQSEEYVWDSSILGQVNELRQKLT